MLVDTGFPSHRSQGSSEFDIVSVSGRAPVLFASTPICAILRVTKPSLLRGPLLAKVSTASWNAMTRAVISRIAPEKQFCPVEPQLVVHRLSGPMS